jgi:hypothetical protein
MNGSASGMVIRVFTTQNMKDGLVWYSALKDAERANATLFLMRLLTRERVR